MSPSKVIRIDEQVWAELQSRARPLEDTPNSVLRRVFGLPEEGARPASIEPRVTRLLALVRDLVGQMPQVEAARKGYSFLSRTGMVVADLRPQKERLRAEASKTVAETAGLNTWDREGSAGFYGGPAVRWYAADGDDAGYQHLAVVLAKLWRSDPEPEPPPGCGPPHGVAVSQGDLKSGLAHQQPDHGCTSDGGTAGSRLSAAYGERG